MKKDLIKLLISEYQQRVSEVNLHKRPFLLDGNLNYVFTGLRRAGKSYLMYQIIQQKIAHGASKEECLYFNFEDDRIDSIELSDLDLIKVCFEEMYDVRPVFFLDEIQIVAKWEKFVRRLADQGYRVYVAGSNAKMFSSEIATTLGGRFMMQNVYPFSFPEFLHSKGINPNEKNIFFTKSIEISKAFQSYFYFGGLPEIRIVSDKRAWLSGLFQKLFFGDLISRFQIRNNYALKVLIRKLAESVKQPASYNRLANVVSSSGKKISTDTVIDYISYLKETWLIFGIENINAKLAEKESNKKYYFTDNGILNLFLTDPNTALLENMVAVRLMQIYENDVFYYQNGVEVDFYIPSAQLAIQVSYSVADDSTRKRELHALIKLSRHLQTKEMCIITRDESNTIEYDGITIDVIPLWKWLLIK